MCVCVLLSIKLDPVMLLVLWTDVVQTDPEEQRKRKRFESQRRGGDLCNLSAVGCVHAAGRYRRALRVSVHLRFLWKMPTVITLKTTTKLYRWAGTEQHRDDSRRWRRDISPLISWYIILHVVASVTCLFVGFHRLCVTYSCSLVFKCCFKVEYKYFH